jgi:hypothetical protein
MSARDAAYRDCERALTNAWKNSGFGGDETITGFGKRTWSSIYVQPSCLPVNSRASVTTSRRFSLRCACFHWDSGRQVWPPPRRSMESAFAAVAPPHNSHRFSGDWAKANEMRAAAQRAEQQRMADFYARQTQQQEQRENAEARERFEALQRKNRI